MSCRGETEADGKVDLGLQKDYQAMAMIPTYITSVPNGTEKVRRTSLHSGRDASGQNPAPIDFVSVLTPCRACTWPSIWGGPIFASAR